MAQRDRDRHRLAFGELAEHRRDAVQRMTVDAVERAVERVVPGEHRPVDAVADRAHQRVQRGDALVVGGVADLGQPLPQAHPVAHRQEVGDRVGVRGRQHAEGECGPPHTGGEGRRFACTPDVFGDAPAVEV